MQNRAGNGLSVPTSRSLGAFRLRGRYHGARRSRALPSRQLTMWKTIGGLSALTLGFICLLIGLAIAGY